MKRDGVQKVDKMSKVITVVVWVGTLNNTSFFYNRNFKGVSYDGKSKEMTDHYEKD